jgi:hypothetical protein
MDMAAVVVRIGMRGHAEDLLQSAQVAPIKGERT